MIIIFDLDDTLYLERNFVMSGFQAVSEFGLHSYGCNKSSSLKFMTNYLDKYGRGQIFDKWLKTNKIYSKSKLLQCIKIYRNHKPNIELPINSTKILKYLSTFNPLYLVTDGHKVVQNNKIKALGLDTFFRKCLITHNYGIKNAKPSLHCFEIIKNKMNCSWNDLIYIGDNPHKDFVNLNKVGAFTIRVLTGSYSGIKAKSGYDAKYTIKNLEELPNLLNNQNINNKFI